MTFCQSPHRDDVIRLLCTYPEVRRTLTSRKCALTPGTQQPRNVAVGPTTDQMRAEAALTIVRALGVRTVTGGELHGSLLMQTVCCASGVYRERSRCSLIRMHTRYRGTPPVCVAMSYLLLRGGPATQMASGFSVVSAGSSALKALRLKAGKA